MEGALLIEWRSPSNAVAARELAIAVALALAPMLELAMAEASEEYLPVIP
jgi:hypothetical protein